MICEMCGQRFQPKRRDARTCSARCRKRASRMAVERDLSVTVDLPTPSTCDIPSARGDPPADGRPRWVDRWGFIHASPGPSRVRLGAD
jgi:hypothetical protein